VLFSHPKGWVSSASAPPPPGTGEIFPPFVWPPVLSRMGAICPLSARDYMVSSRADDLLCSPGGVADSLSLNSIISWPGHVDRGSRFCVHKLRWVLDVPDAVFTWHFWSSKREKRSQKKKGLAAVWCSTQISRAIMYHKKVI
jgi:hypothetical protein